MKETDEESKAQSQEAETEQERQLLQEERAQRHAGGPPRVVSPAATPEDIERAKKAAGL